MSERAAPRPVEAELSALTTAIGPAPSAASAPAPSSAIGPAPSVAIAPAPSSAIAPASSAAIAPAPPAAIDPAASGSSPGAPGGEAAIDELGLMIAKEPRFSRRQIAIALGAAGLFAVLVLSLALSKGTPKPPPPRGHAASPAPASPVAPVKPAPPAQAAAAPPAPAPTAAPPPTEAPSEAAADPAPIGEAPHHHNRHLLGGKKVVLEYDPKPADSKPAAREPAGEDPGVVARARRAYHHGNQRLFSGDDAGAIAAYREALRIYPGYVAGYRGLGLAYEEKGDKRQALEALRTYVRTVPTAKDVALIQKRIDHLER
jgi:hypothetical protein